MAIVAIILIYSIELLKTEYEKKKLVNYKFVKGDIHWNNPTINTFTMSAIFGGMIASLVGLGGGVIFTPLMLEFGVNPKVANSTSMYMIMINTFSTSCQFFLLGVVKLDYAIFLSIIVVVSTFIGNKLLDYIILKTGRVSLMAVFLAIVMILCTIIVFISTGLQISKDIEEEINMFAFGNY